MDLDRKKIKILVYTYYADKNIPNKWSKRAHYWSSDAKELFFILK